MSVTLSSWPANREIKSLGCGQEKRLFESRTKPAAGSPHGARYFQVKRSPASYGMCG